MRSHVLFPSGHWSWVTSNFMSHARVIYYSMNICARVCVKNILNKSLHYYHYYYISCTKGTKRSLGKQIIWNKKCIPIQWYTQDSSRSSKNALDGITLKHCKLLLTFPFACTLG